MKPFNFYFPTKVIFGRKKISELASVLPAQNDCILIVTDKNIATRTPILEAVLSQRGERRIFVFDGVRENPDFSNVEAGGRFARDIKAGMIIGLGGGSSMDAAKGVAMLATNNRNLCKLVKGEPLVNPPLPMICIPTTSGSGSEATPYAVFTDLEEQTKIGYANPGLFPVASIVDPELTYSMPRTVAASTGLDAMTHALESYLSTEGSALNDSLALLVIESVVENLNAALRKDQTAMDVMAYNAVMAGIVITHGGTILPHIMGYCLTMFHGVPHGIASCALLPAVLDFLRDHSPANDKLKKLDGSFAPHGGVKTFLEGLGVSTRLSSYGVHPEELEGFVRKVIIKSDIHITPALITDRDILHIYQSAL